MNKDKPTAVAQHKTLEPAQTERRVKRSLKVMKNTHMGRLEPRLKTAWCSIIRRNLGHKKITRRSRRFSITRQKYLNDVGDNVKKVPHIFMGIFLLTMKILMVNVTHILYTYTYTHIIYIYLYT